MTRGGLFMLPLCIGLAACATPEPNLAELEKNALGFLHHGKTTKQEILMRWGIPSASFEEDRILTYRMTASAARGLVARPGSGREYHLILVFDDASRLTEHKLVAP